MGIKYNSDLEYIYKSDEAEEIDEYIKMMTKKRERKLNPPKKTNRKISKAILIWRHYLKKSGYGKVYKGTDKYNEVKKLCLDNADKVGDPQSSA
jgi:hypothetical protein